MTAPNFPGRSVQDAAIALVDAAEQLRLSRAESGLVVVALETRWAANRAARKSTRGAAEE